MATIKPIPNFEAIKLSNPAERLTLFTATCKFTFVMLTVIC